MEKKERWDSVIHSFDERANRSLLAGERARRLSLLRRQSDLAHLTKPSGEFVNEEIKTKYGKMFGLNRRHP